MSLFYNVKAAVIKWFGDIKFYKYPLFLLFGHVAYKIKGEEQRQILNVLEPGDILLRRYDHYISGLMIPGYFTHAAVYVGDNNVIHMLGEGINQEDILTFMRCDDIAVLRFTNEQKIPLAILKAKEQLQKGVEYDFDFNFKKNDKFSCTEFVHFIFDYPPLIRMKDSYVVPDDFKRTSSIFKTIWEKKRTA